MSVWLKKLQSWLTAVAFAEAGEHETALELAGFGRAPARQRAGVLETLNRVYAAAAFAEENCHATAGEILDAPTPRLSFLEHVGLAGVRVWYGTVPAEPRSFLEEVGLGGVRVRYATLTL